jgi:hypothetical protein
MLLLPLLMGSGKLGTPCDKPGGGGFVAGYGGSLRNCEPAQGYERERYLCRNARRVSRFFFRQLSSPLSKQIESFPSS